MKYSIILLIFICSGYSLSYAKYSWRNNRRVAIGVTILVLLSVALPVLLMFFR